MSKAEPKDHEFLSAASLGWALAKLLRDYQKQVEAALNGLPGGSRSFLVMSIVDRERCQSQISIAEKIGLDKTTLTYLLDGLEGQGLIKRVTDPNDRRSRHIVLTEQGVKALAQHSKAVQAVEHGLLARLGGDEAKLFQTWLFRVAGVGEGFKPPLDEAETAEICRASLASESR
ncbi:MarR family winged helix-turn-helix transcriptional regulator [Devosia soli]|uniref:MarR family winged helix-turn-helix transcriptional regulator n=1 Tax=Devosia soli TaxID=361041 RepID=UPI00069C10EA|nr:MarR family transcriptional regulator [Devosia soli]